MGGGDTHGLRGDAIVEFFNAGNIVRFGAIKAEALIGVACGELQRQHTHADQVRTVDTFEAFGDNGFDAQHNGSLGSPIT